MKALWKVLNRPVRPAWLAEVLVVVFVVSFTAMFPLSGHYQERPFLLALICSVLAGIALIVLIVVWTAVQILSYFRSLALRMRSRAQEKAHEEIRQNEGRAGDGAWGGVGHQKASDNVRVVPIGKDAKIEAVRLRNIRGFENLDVSFSGPSGAPRTATLVIGKNGTNKTTLLRCIVLGLADNVDSSSLITQPIGSLISEGAQSGKIEIDLRGADGRTYAIKKVVRSSSDGKEYLESEGPSYKLFVCAYGAGRAGMGVDQGREYRILDSVLNLFDYSEKLLDSELTLRRLKDASSRKQYAATKAGLKRILNLSLDDDIRPGKGGGVEVLESSLGEWVRLESWADGYRLTLGWLLDLFGWAMRADSVDRDGMPQGIVLVDEMDQHLHPSMQARVLGEIKAILPGMQIIATTHSPLMALGAEPEELVVLRRAGGRVEKVDPIPDFSFYSAEDMLVDEALFDTPPHKAKVNELLEKYHRLAAIPPDRLTDPQRRELKALADQLAARQIISRRDEAEDAEVLKLLRQLESSSTSEKAS